LTAAEPDIAGAIPRRLSFYNAGFLTQPRLRRILALAGHDLRLARSAPGDGVVVWGHSPYAHRGEAAARRHALPLIRIEDAFLRSVHPGRSGDPPLGLMIDPSGVHFDSTKPSALEHILARHPLDDSNLMARARDGIARLRVLDLSKYNNHHPEAPLPAPGYVLVIDQTRGDASIAHAGASAITFREMLVLAQTEHPTARIVIKTHPETRSGHRPGHFTTADATGRISLLADPVSPHRLLEGAIAVYTVSSQMGFEAVLAGHRPVVLGQPFYIGWSLTDDRAPLPRRTRTLSRTQLFAAALILAPTWYDPCRDRLCAFEEAVDQLEAEVRAWREDRRGHVAAGMRLWKRSRLQDFFGRQKPLIFANDPARAATIAAAKNRSLLIWAGKAPPDTAAIRVEDGFLRSRGLGAELIPPLSLVTDDLGIYYDPTRESRLERLIQAPLPPGAGDRASDLIHRLIAQRVSKYNLPGTLLDLPQGNRILVPGQVEDDASIRLGSPDITTNFALLNTALSANPGAILIYKPHPDVESGLRPGAISANQLAAVRKTATDTGAALLIASHADALALIDACDAVWTMTSLLGFEALLRGKSVTCLGAPFYAGWGLTIDRCPIPLRRKQAPDGHPLPRPTLNHLVHAALIAYPRYYDPVARLPCPPEVAVDRLSQGRLPRPGLPLRLLAKLQGAFASQARLWR
jgi:capsular polysaccharide export protein